MTVILVRLNEVISNDLLLVLVCDLRVVIYAVDAVHVRVLMRYVGAVITVSTRVDLRQVLQVFTLFPSSNMQLSTVLLYGPVLRPMTYVARRLVVRITVVVLRPGDVVDFLIRALIEVVLRQLPLNALFPVDAATYAVFAGAVARASERGAVVRYLRLAHGRFIYEGLVLREISCLVASNKAGQLTNE